MFGRNYFCSFLSSFKNKSKDQNCWYFENGRMKDQCMHFWSSNIKQKLQETTPHLMFLRGQKGYQDNK